MQIQENNSKLSTHVFIFFLILNPFTYPIIASPLFRVRFVSRWAVTYCANYLSTYRKVLSMSPHSWCSMRFQERETKAEHTSYWYVFLLPTCGIGRVCVWCACVGRKVRASPSRTKRRHSRALWRAREHQRCRGPANAIFNLSLCFIYQTVNSGHRATNKALYRLVYSVRSTLPVCQYAELCSCPFIFIFHSFYQDSLLR